MPDPSVVVFGGTGEIGRWLVVELTAADTAVALVLRNAQGRQAEFSSWIEDHGGDASKIVYVEGDLTLDRLGLGDRFIETLTAVRLVYNLSGRYAWGMTRPEAAAVNVVGAARVVDFAAALPGRPRLVHVSGYLVASQKRLDHLGLRRDPAPTEREWTKLYRRLGPYEASKIEGDFVVRAQAGVRNVDLTVINPGAVIGHSGSGELRQITGFAEIVDQLWRGALSAIPGRPTDWVPHVPVDYVARFMARAPGRDTQSLAEYTLICPDTPRFGAFVGMVAKHMGLRAPRRHVPVGIVRFALKAGLGRVMGVSAEPLSFLTSFDFETETADRAAAAVGLERPRLQPALGRTLDYLIATEFSAHPDHRGGFENLAGAATFVEGGADAQIVLLHGLPLTSRSWRAVRAHLDVEALAPDLPGQGRSQLDRGLDEADWLDSLSSHFTRPIKLVAHSYACALAVDFAARHPDKISGLVLISPYFLGDRPAFFLRHPFLAASVLRLAVGRRLQSLGQDAAHLRRPGAIKRLAEHLRRVGDEADRRRLRHQLAVLASSRLMPIKIVNGENDPPRWPTAASVERVVIPDAGHNPQLTHAPQVAQAIGAR
ncbi:short chain dehydrogenase [Brevundimonas sp. SH203]|uniref:alpha/beta fold hydrolase n=1 Tax=Brevundimonas sp. SH203 TaxID=345167 RepID=UPI0009CC9496|nr:alpha/beta fold hydrolase [Brevundimonas sp. SH203]GAW42274.1 short chain dehydrogenase [Brevundimonas sp. SH203]